MEFNTPILFLIFNRPAQTKEVFEELRKLKPTYLFVAADGPRDHVAKDKENAEATRSIIDTIDWPCEVKTLFRNENLGCRDAVSSAIDWFFDQVEEGIILEDDCLPVQSFFPFCQQLLEQYRHDTRIMQIGGSNIVANWRESELDYFFSYYGSVWGWATWRRAWKYYDVTMKLWKHLDTKRALSDILGDKQQYEKRVAICDAVYEDRIDTWDYQWTFCKLINSGLSITSAINLVSNIGFTADATHTASENHLSNIKREELTAPLRSNEVVVADRAFDKLFFQKSKGTFLSSLKNKLYSLIPKSKA